jgi:hypothetical protein
MECYRKSQTFMAEEKETEEEEEEEEPIPLRKPG